MIRKIFPPKIWRETVAAISTQGKAVKSILNDHNIRFEEIRRFCLAKNWPKSGIITLTPVRDTIAA
jgi:hypothetical protein